jgi:hypothetical protein
MAVELLVPLTAVAQLATAFLCGVCLFQVRSTVMQQLGFVPWQPWHGEFFGDCLARVYKSRKTKENLDLLVRKCGMSPRKVGF